MSDPFLQIYWVIKLLLAFSDSCVDKQWKCNCDVNNSTETSDEGFLTDKDKLPVTELQFGDLQPTENGWFTLGPLICTGRVN